MDFAVAELSQGERLQPSLLDRLRDDLPKKRKAVKTGGATAGLAVTGIDANLDATMAAKELRETSTSHVINARQLRECVKRDLAWLLNSGCLEDVTDLSPFPNVAESVLNFGLPDLTGLVASNLDTQALERKLAKIICRFEPRIIKRSLRVSISTSEVMRGNALKFEIECDVWGQPAPERLYLHSEIDLENGSFDFQGQGG